jgi:hypothetical protein
VSINHIVYHSREFCTLLPPILPFAPHQLNWLLYAERILTKDEREQHQSEVRQRSEFSVVLDCLEAFSNQIKISVDFTINDLEAELINSKGVGDTIITQLHLVRSPCVNYSLFPCIITVDFPKEGQVTRNASFLRSENELFM